MENRIYKFRGWHKHNNGKDEIPYMVYFDLYDLVDGRLDGDGKFMGFLDSCELMQFTGLLDKNGKEIYEGDLLKMLGRIGNVYWDDTGLWAAKWNEPGFNHRLFPFGSSQLEVIGNIYENPELLR